MPETVTDTPNSRSRACDRCHALKTQCSIARPCVRCARLGVACTNNRPLPARGRPPKGSPQARISKTTRPRRRNSTPEEAAPEELEEATPQSLQYVSTPADVALFLQDAEDLPVQADVATSLFYQLLTAVSNFGFYSIIPGSIHLIARQDESAAELEAEIFRPELRSVLLAIALEIYAHRLPRDVRNDLEISRDTLQMNALAVLPSFTWKSNQIQLSHVLMLLLLSHTWCMAEPFAKISLRWCSLARVIFDDYQKIYRNESIYAGEMMRRTVLCLNLQESILVFIDNSRDEVVLLPATKIPPSRMTDAEWCAFDQSSDSNQQPPPESHSFFALFHPFINIVRLIVKEPEFNSAAFIEVRNKLEDYFFKFPEEILLLSSVTKSYQFEAMIWMHGLFITLYSTRDFVNLLKQRTYTQITRFGPMLEHSLLLGEIITPLQAIDPHLEAISPPTMYFVFLSSVVHTLALQQFVAQPELQPFDVPEKLIASCNAHLRLLKSIEACDQQYDKLLVSELHRILSSFVDRVISNIMGEDDLSWHVISLYRWTPRGTGMIRMSEADAEREWDYPSSPRAKLWAEPLQFDDVLILAIRNMCSSEKRMCEDGYFDLSISITL